MGYETKVEAGTGFLDVLLAAGLLLPSGVDGLYGRNAAYEAVFDGIGRCFTRLAAGDGAEFVRLPPGMSRAVLEKAGYMKGFPHLAGTVHSFCGDEAGHRRLLAELDGGTDWTGQQAATEIVMTPAACYPLYPMVAARGPLGADGALFDVESYCFRHEPSIEPTRMQMFRMREFVRVGTPEQATAHLDTWRARVATLAEALGLPNDVIPANDPFFGRGGRMMAGNQRDSGLKMEFVVPVNDGAPATACLSFNSHRDHFGGTWSITLADGRTAHSACIGIGMDRIVLALLKHHGVDVASWQPGLRAFLEL